MQRASSSEASSSSDPTARNRLRPPEVPLEDGNDTTEVGNPVDDSQSEISRVTFQDRTPSFALTVSAASASDNGEGEDTDSRSLGGRTLRPSDSSISGGGGLVTSAEKLGKNHPRGPSLGHGQGGRKSVLSLAETFEILPKHHPLGWRHLIKRPVIRQWQHDGYLYYEPTRREVSRFELFFDLVFVGVIHVQAETAMAEVSAINVVKFILTFYPSWSVWLDVGIFLNRSGVDDIPQRVYILAVMLSLIGFASNAAGIDLMVDRAGNYNFSPEAHQALRAAVGFFLFAKVLKLGIFIVYALSLPKFRLGQVLLAVGTFVIACVYLPIIFVRQSTAVVVLACLGLVLEVSSRYFVGLGIAKKIDEKSFRASSFSAPDCAHLIERFTAFVVIVLGEAVINASYRASAASSGLRPQYGRACMCMIITFLVTWVYFDSDSSRMFIHALRRHWFSAISFTTIHWPFCASLVLVSAAMSNMVQRDVVDQGVRWYFGGGLAVAMLCLAALGFSHKHLDKPRSSWIPRSIRLGLRLVVGILFALLPLTPNRPSLQLLGIHAGILFVLVTFETLGQLGSIGKDPEEVPIDASTMSGGHSVNRSTRAFGDLDGRSTFSVKGMAGRGTARKATSRAPYHPLGDDEFITDAEKGEEDLSAEDDFSKLTQRELFPQQRLAYAV